MINKLEFDSIRKVIEKEEEEREKIITESREIIKLSKQIIYSLHREEIKEAEKLVQKIKKLASDLNRAHRDTGMNKVALQEYVEAMCVYDFFKNGKLPSIDSLKVDAESYLLGLADFTGELVRIAVNSIIRNKTQNLDKIRSLVSNIYGEFLKLTLRNGELRKKSDMIKYNLKRIDEVLYDLKIRRK